MKENKIKTTFTIGIPRCGSLALSLMMNNDACVAHHEGQDYAHHYKLPFEQSFAYKRMKAAHAAGKHYFNTDISCYPSLISSMVDRELSLKDLCLGRHQFLYISPDPDACARSIVSRGLARDDQHTRKTVDDLLLKAESYYQMLMGIKATVLVIENGKKVDYVDDKRYFSYSQLTEIGEFTGAIEDPFFHNNINHLRFCSFSMSNRQIIKGGEIMLESAKEALTYP